MAASGHLVIVGGGMAAARLLKRLADLGVANQPTTLISAEPVLPYNRVLLPDLLAGHCTEAEMTLLPSGWYEQQGVRVLRGNPVSAIDPANRALVMAGGGSVSYRRLVLATGAVVPQPDIPGLSLEGVTRLRTVADAHELRRHAAAADVCVVGGGLLGLETARSLAASGARVQVIHRADRLMNRQLDQRGSDIVRSFLEELGIGILLEESTVALEGKNTVERVRLRSGAEVAARHVVFATGTRPNDALARQAGLEVDHGVVTTAGMQTSDPAVFALGECARVHGVAHAMVEPVYRQADVLATRFAGGCATFAAPSPATRLKIAGLSVFAAGTVSAAPGTEDVLIEDPARRVYRRFCYQDGRLTGAVLIGDSSGSRAVQECIDTGGRNADPMQLAFARTAAA